MNPIATRQSYGEELVQLGSQNPNIVVLDADLSGATMTKLFRQEHPDRFIDCGIAEANMLTAAAGLATTGMVPFASTFAMFAAGRGFEQIRNSIAYPRLNVKICATHAGISVGADGATHQAIEDLSLMRSIPGMVVLNPCDDKETRACLHAAHEYDGPVYIRLSRHPVEPVYTDCDFEIGRGKILKEGTDAALIATGIEVQETLKAAEILEKEGIHCRVVNLVTIKPVDKELILDCARHCGRLVTVEEHNIIGGLGSAVAETVSESCPVPILRIGVEDCFGQSGNGNELLHAYGLDADSIAMRVLTFIHRSDKTKS